ncbi:uncharacterized protein LY89DRAFT_725196 [Mollisia scopiformis]|uniref:BTB domain-containing protein n=1 Tax=Mollisia scopiformis TaxID=149040 RepID=A0A132B7B2_MOLSC|nr:uncharacterized protein LY89DRAFT_725196 [Mollisia scopiformis]KUJ08295.1 hypothetical protein LY89DRAFT_725196 [Mollisia scopiformis]
MTSKGGPTELKKAPAQTLTTKKISRREESMASASDLPAQKKQKTEPDSMEKSVGKPQQTVAPKQKRNAFSESLGFDTIVILVGEDKYPYTLHKSRLCAISDFFEKAFTGLFKEANEKQMILNDVDIATFDGFVEWLYQNSISLSDKPKTEAKLDFLLDVYILADMIMSEALKNFAMDKIQDTMYDAAHVHLNYEGSILNPTKLRGVLSLASVQRVFENTTSSRDAPIRQYCAALASHWIIRGGDAKHVAGYFMIDGFVEEFSDYQTSTRHKVFGFEHEDYGPRIRDDPRISGEHPVETECGDMPIGHEICHFHIHRESGKCMSITNWVDHRHCPECYSD